MRTNDVLKELDDVLVLYQYLYIDPENRIVVDNGMAELEIRLDEDLQFHYRNLNFPHLPEMDYSEQMTLNACTAVVDCLKRQKPKQFPGSCNSEWDEIRAVTSASMTLAFCKSRRHI